MSLYSRLSFLLFIFLCLNLDLQAQSVNIHESAPFYQTGLNSFTPYQFGSHGEAVNLMNGNLLLNFPDATIPGRANFNLVINRSYNFVHRVEPFVVDPQVYSGFVNDLREYYDFGNNINSAYFCYAMIERGYYIPQNVIDCNIQEGQYYPLIDQLVPSSFARTRGSWNLSSLDATNHNQYNGNAPIHLDLSVNLDNIDENSVLLPLGEVDLIGNRLQWVPPANRWIFSLAPYIGVVTFTNVFPFEKKGQFLALFIRNDGGVELYDEKGRSLSGSNLAKFITYINEEGNEAISPLSHSNAPPRRQRPPDNIDMTHNTSHQNNIGSIQLTNDGLDRYTFEKIDSRTLNVDLSVMGGLIDSNRPGFILREYDIRYFRLNDLPHWKIEFFRLKKIRDLYNNQIRYSYNENNTQITATDSLGKRTRIIYDRDENQVRVSLPPIKQNQPRQWRYNLDNQGRIVQVIDPVSNSTTISYDCCGEHPLHRIGQAEFEVDHFIELEYPNAGITRYEVFSSLDFLRNEDNWSAGALITEFPNRDDGNTYHQKYIEIFKENAESDIRTTVFELDGSRTRYFFRELDKIVEDSDYKTPLLIEKRYTFDNHPEVIEFFDWKVRTEEYQDAALEDLEGIEAKKITLIDGIFLHRVKKDEMLYFYSFSYDERGFLIRSMDSFGNIINYNYNDNLIDEIARKAYSIQDDFSDRVENEIYHLPKLLSSISTSYQTSFGGDEIDFVAKFYRTQNDLCSGQRRIPFQVNKIVKRINNGGEELVKQACFNDNGNNIEVRGTDNYLARYIFDDDGFRPIEMTANDVTTTYRYNLIGDLTRVRSNNGQTLSFDYDKLRRLKEISYSNGSRVQHRYFLRNNLNNQNRHNKITTTIHDAVTGREHNVQRFYNGINLLEKIIKDESEVLFSYNDGKRLSQYQFNQNPPYQLSYDGFGRVIEQVYPSGEALTYSYSYLGGGDVPTQKSSVFINDQEIRSIYQDANDRIVRLDQVSGDEILTYRFNYNEFGSLLRRETPSGLITENLYDNELRLIGRIFPGGDQVNYNNRDANDSFLDQIILLQGLQADSIQVSGNFDYDNQGRVTSIDFPPISNQDLNDYIFEYEEGNGDLSSRDRVTSLIDNSGESLFTYHTSGGIESIEKEVEVLGQSYEFEYAYDAFGNDYVISYPNQFKVYYEINDRGQLASVRKNAANGPIVASFSYNDLDLVQSVEYGNGILTEYDYSYSGRINYIQTSKDGELLARQEYLYDEFGNKSQIVYADASRVEFDYEFGTHWLKEARYYKAGQQEAYNTQVYRYDGEGNRVSYEDAYKSIDYDYDREQNGDLRSNKLLRYRSDNGLLGEMEYDIRGNLLRQREVFKGREILNKSFTYDFQDRLVSLEVHDNNNNYHSESTYTYDYASRRSQKVEDGKSKYYLYGKSIEPMVELDENGEFQKTFIYAGGRKIASFEGDDIHYFHHDELGNLLQLTNEKASVVQNLRYDPFGNINFKSEDKENPYQYAGKENDGATGLIYFGARYYDARLGRFLTQDPAEYGFNHYVYAGNNPTNNRDIYGLYIGSYGSPVGSIIGGIGNLIGQGLKHISKPLGNFITHVVNQIDFPKLFYTMLFIPQKEINEVCRGTNDCSIHDFDGPVKKSYDSFGNLVGIVGSIKGENSIVAFLDLSGEGLSIEKLKDGIGLESSLDQGPIIPSDPSYSGLDSLLPNFTIGSSLPGPGLETLSGGDSHLDGFRNTIPNQNSLPPINPKALNNSSFPIPSELPSVSTPQVNPMMFPNNLAPSSLAFNSGPGIPAIQFQNQSFNNVTGLASNSSFDGGSSLSEDNDVLPNSAGLNEEEDTASSSTQDEINENGNPVGDDPVMLSNGDLLQRIVDLTIKGRGFDFEFVRTYRSRIQYLGPLGHNWDHNYNKRLIEQEDGDILRRDGRGRYDIYRLLDNGSYQSPSGFYDTLIKNRNGTYRIRDRFGMVEQYAEDGFLSLIEDRYGNQMTFSYEGDGDDKRLSLVRDTLGREIRYAYVANGPHAGRLDFIQDFSGRQLDFDYDENNDLVSVTSPATADYPNGNTKTYVYSSGYPEESDFLNHNLIQAIDAKGQLYLENEYTATDRVRRQRFGEGDFTYDYQFLNAFEDCRGDDRPDPSIRASRTIVVDRRGNRSEFVFNCQGNYVEMKDYTRSLRPEDPSFYLTRFTYNQDGQMASVIYPEGNELRYVYQGGEGNDRGNLIRIERHADADRPGADPLVTLLTYEPRYNLVSRITDPLGQVILNNYDDNGNLLSRQLPAITLDDGAAHQITETFTYNEHGQVLSRTDGEGAELAFDYYDQGEQRGYLRSISKDPDGLNLSQIYRYDDRGNIVSFSDARGNDYSMTINELDQVKEIRTPNPLNDISRFHYDENNNLARTEVQNKDQDGQIDPDLPWITTEYVYDELDHLSLVINQVDENNTLITEYHYDESENLSRIIEPEGNSIKINYDERDLPFEVIQGYGSREEARIQIAYDANGQIKKRIDGNGNEVFYNYDAYDRLIEEIYPLGQSLNLSYDLNDNLTQIQRRGPPNAQDNNARLLYQLDLNYDPLNRLLRERETLLDENFNQQGFIDTSYSYNHRHQVNQVIDPNQNERTYIYDTIGRLTQLNLPLGYEIHRTYDENNNLLSQSSHEPDLAAGVNVYTTAYRYDSLNRPIEKTVQGNHVTRYGYDSRSNLREVTDMMSRSGLDDNQINNNEGNRVLFEYDGMNRLTFKFQELRENGIGQGDLIDTITTEYRYDANSRLSSIIDSNQNETQYRYDSLNRLIERRLPQDQITTYRYDRNSNLVSLTDPRDINLSLIYDSLNRLVDKEVYLGVNFETRETFAYDGLSRLVQANVLNADDDPLIRVARQYDSLSRLIQESQNGRSVRRTYDAIGNITNILYPSGKSIDKRYDSLNRLTRVQDPRNNIANILYQNLNRIGQEDYFNQTNSIRDFDLYKRLTTTSDQTLANELISSFDYAYDKKGNRLYEILGHFNGRGHTYKYDSAYRLIEARLSIPDPLEEIQNPGSQDYAQKVNWEIDHVDNWVRQTEDTTPNIVNDEQITNYESNDLNQITAINNEALIYDESGNLIRDENYVYEYDYRNFLKVVRDPDNDEIVTQFFYDALGRRVAKGDHINNQTTNYIYDGYQVIEDRDENDQVLATYVYGEGLDNIIQMSTNGQGYIYHKDEQRSIVAVTDRNGILIEKYVYSPYGEVGIFSLDNQQRANSIINNRYLYTGREYDAELGLYYYRNRTYHPELGRFLQRDPLGYSDGMNVYAYVGSSPLNWVDPWGLYEEDVHRGLVEYLAKQAGFGIEEARLMAEYSQGIDESQLTSPINLGVVNSFLRGHPLVYGITKEMLRKYHFPRGPSEYKVLPNSKYARAMITRGIKNSDFKEFSKGLHPLADSWSHQGIPSLGNAGHPVSKGGPLDRSADYTYKYHDEAMDMSKHLHEAMIDFLTSRGDIDFNEASVLKEKWEDIGRKITPFIRAYTFEDKKEILDEWDVDPGSDGIWDISLPSRIYDKKSSTNVNLPSRVDNNKNSAKKK